MSEKTVLHQFWRSSASWRVRWALRVKRIPFEVVTVDLLASEQDGEPHRERSAMGTVPVLQFDGRFLTESVAILEYLEQTVPKPALYPTDAWARARVRQVVELVNSEIQPFQTRAVYNRASPNEEDRHTWVRHFNVRGLTALERLLRLIDSDLGPGRFAVGNSLTAADLFLVPQVGHSRRYDVDVAPFPRVLAAEAAALATEHADAVRPERQPGAPTI